MAGEIVIDDNAIVSANVLMHTICIVNILNHFVGETATAQADDVDAAESDRFASWELYQNGR